MDTIKWGIVGLGKIARKFAEALQYAKGGGVLSAVASRNGYNANKFGSEFNVPYRFESYEALIKSPNVDVVYIATPHPSHAELAEQCLKEGKAVLCEKPSAMSFDQIKRVVELSHRQQVFYMEAFWTRFLPSFERTLEIVQEGALGKVQHVLADFSFKADFDPSSRLFNKELGGGALMDVGVYPIFLAYKIMGMPTKIHASAVNGSTGVDENTSILFEYANGRLATLSCGITTSGPCEAYIAGDKASLKLHAPWHGQSDLSMIYDRTRSEGFQLNRVGNGLQYEIEEVHHCIREKAIESKKMSHQDSLNLMALVDLVKVSAGMV